ncbi:MAG: hypothetical protein AB7P21_07955 [Lautropia sp.]
MIRSFNGSALAAALLAGVVAFGASTDVAAQSAKKKAPAAQQVAAADESQMAASRVVYLGRSNCEFNQSISVTPNQQYPGYVDLAHGKKRWLMRPVISPTGAVRLEDVRNEALLIQIGSKTMLMNQKTGQRMVDNCIHPQQAGRVAAK